jgi:hypothetical protein
MRINGEWLLCDDGVVRPAIRAELLADDGAWKAVEFLVDIGADRTVLNADILSKLGLPLLEAAEGLSGLGGGTDSVEIETTLHLRRDTGSPSPSTAGLPRSLIRLRLTSACWAATSPICSR